MSDDLKDFPERAAQAISREGTDAASVAILESRVVPVLERIEANTRGVVRDLGKSLAVATKEARVPATAKAPEKTQEDRDREELRGRATGMREAMAKREAVAAKADDTLAVNAGAWKDPNKEPVAASTVGTVASLPGRTLQDQVGRAASFVQGIPQIARPRMPELASAIQSQAGGMVGGVSIPGLDALTQKLTSMTEAFGNMKLDREKDTASQEVPNISMEFDDRLLMLLAHDRL